MKQAHGWYLPDHEQHLIEWMSHPKNVRKVVDGRVMYQAVKQQTAMALCKRFRTAVDVGAHCGLWSFYLAKRFDRVHAFEPVDEHRRCFVENVGQIRDATTIHDVIARSAFGSRGGVWLHPYALGECESRVSIHTSKGSSGDSWVKGDGDIPMRTLDSFNLQDVDFIKIDCEGHELLVLRGAEETLKRCKPCVIVEQKPGRAQMHGLGERDAVPYLESLGAVLRKSISGDFLFSWNETT